MCNLFDNRVSFSDLVAAFGQIRRPVLKPRPGSAPNLEPLDAVRPTDSAPVVRAYEDGVELTAMRWGFIADRPKAAPIINFRSEGRRFAQGRCLVPANGFCEFTGKAYPKTRWRFTLTGEPWLCMAGLWRRQETPQGPADRFTLLTTAPGPDMAPYHDRQVVVLPREHWAAWLSGQGSEAELLVGLPKDSLSVERQAPAEPEMDLPLFGAAR